MVSVRSAATWQSHILAGSIGQFAVTREFPDGLHAAGGNGATVKSAAGEYVRFDFRGRPVKNAVGRVGPQQRTVDRLIRAAILSAQGMTPAEVAKAIGATVKRLRDWKSRHAAIWKKAFDDEASRLRPVIVGQAGTDVIVKDPESYLRKATAVER